MQTPFVKTEKQKKWLEKLSSFENDIREEGRKNEELGEFCSRNIQTLRKIGYTKLTLPASYGGEGFNVYDGVLIHERLASFDGNTALTIAWQLLTVGDLFESNSWKKEKLAFFAHEVKKGAIVNRCASEAATGSPTRGGKPQTVAVRNGNQWIINGRKSYTTGSYELDYFLVSAWIEELETIGFFLVSKKLEGVSIEENWDVVSMRATGSHDLVLNNVVVQDSDFVENPKEVNQRNFTSGWLLLIPATYLGIAQAARDYAVQFANTHSPNSIKGPIVSLPNVQTIIGEMDLELTKLRFVLYGAAEMAIDPDRSKYITNEINVAKHTVINGAMNIVDKAMRLVGAKSLQRSNPLQQYYRDVRAGLHNPPMDDFTISQLAQTAIQQYKEKGERKNEVEKVK